MTDDNVRERDSSRDKKYEEGQPRFQQRGRERRKSHWLKELGIKMAVVMLVVVFVTTVTLSFQVQKRNAGIAKIDHTTEEMRQILREFKKQASKSPSSPGSIQQALQAIARTEKKVNEIERLLKEGG